MPAPRSMSSATRNRIRRASCWAKRCANAEAPGVMAGRRPRASGWRRWRSSAARPMSVPSSVAWASSAPSPALRPEPWTSRTILRSSSRASLSSRARMALAPPPVPRRKPSGRERGSARGPRACSKRTSAARESASTAATPSSMSRSCRKLPSVEKTTCAMSSEAASSDARAAALGSPAPAAAASASALASSAAATLGPPAPIAALRLPFMRFVNWPKPLASSSMRETVMRRRPL
mmetsp:Transcript_105165/g.328898  ORF Transcript_105165/g.328898 Transcript_105165/m.328898 type:complete len:235 (-) Transcript_105165:1537-2241(-)